MEYAELIEAAKRYLDGSCSIHELNGTVSEYLSTQLFKPGEVQGVVIAEEWTRAINSHWNEWGLAVQPMSDSEFRSWLIEKIQEEGK